MSINNGQAVFLFRCYHICIRYLWAPLGPCMPTTIVDGLITSRPISTSALFGGVLGGPKGSTYVNTFSYPYRCMLTQLLDGRLNQSHNEFFVVVVDISWSKYGHHSAPRHCHPVLDSNANYQTGSTVIWPDMSSPSGTSREPSARLTWSVTNYLRGYIIIRT